MALEKIRQIRGRAVPLPGDDIDTDRIIPARYLKCVTFDGLGDALFYDERFDEHGEPKAQPLNDPRFEGASILISGSNFGCGSSREHAPQSIARAGFRAVIAESFAEIFFGNATTLGLVCMAVAPDARRALTEAVRTDPGLEIELDVEAGRVRAGEMELDAHLPPSAREALLEGYWDPLGELLEGVPEVQAVAERLGHVAAGA
ncbi:MAG: 3-isopropylmalate dehydratase small subunit [Deinococcales bacterium]